MTTGWLLLTETSAGGSLSGCALMSEWLLEDDAPSPSDQVDTWFDPFPTAAALYELSGLVEEEDEAVSRSLDLSLIESLLNRFVCGCSGPGVLAFLFLRSRLVNEGLLAKESDLL